MTLLLTSSHNYVLEQMSSALTTVWGQHLRMQWSFQIIKQAGLKTAFQSTFHVFHVHVLQNELVSQFTLQIVC